MKKFKAVKGRKHPKDNLLLYYGNPVEFKDVAKMCVFFMENEDNIYPPEEGFEGAEKFIKYIKETLNTRKLPNDKDYQLGKELVIND
tara:strand:- start:4454 stop:4714 length:261 start_codon:yes stop_codon:yes gene_type:complete